MVISKKYFNSCTLYILLWVLYSLQGTLYATGGIISRGILLILILWSLYHCYGVNTSQRYRDLPSFIKILNVFIIIHTIYGIILILSGKKLYTMEDYTLTSNLDYLKNVYISTLPIYAFYNFTKKRLITEDFVRAFVIFILCVTIIRFFNAQQQQLAQAMAMRSTREEFTLNVGYSFLHLMPLIFFWNKKPLLQYFLLLVCVCFIIMCMKRGAIMLGAVCFAYFLYSMLKLTKGVKRIVIIAISAIAIMVTVSFVQNMLETSEYFQHRLDQTLEGDSSNRDTIYATFLDHFLNERNPLRILFGNGANATLTIGTNYAHNDWLELAINCGILGLVVYFLYFVTLLKNGIKLQRTNADYSRVLFMSLLILFGASFVSMSYASMGISQTFAIGFLLAHIKQGKKTAENF